MSEIKRLKCFINGEWLESKTEKYMPVYNPSTGDVIAETPVYCLNIKWLVWEIKINNCKSY